MKSYLAYVLLACMIWSCKKDVLSDGLSKTEEAYKNRLVEEFHFKIGSKASAEVLQDKAIPHFATYKEAYEFYSKVEGTYTFKNDIQKKNTNNNQLRTTELGIDYQSYYGYLNTTAHINGALAGTLAISVAITPDVGYYWTRDAAFEPKRYYSSDVRTMNFDTPDYGWTGLGYFDGAVGGAYTSQRHLQQYVQIRGTVEGVEHSSLVNANLNCNVSVSGIPGDEIPSSISVTSTFSATWVE